MRVIKVNKTTISNFVIILLMIMTFIIPLSVSGVPSTINEAISDVILLVMVLILWSLGEKSRYGFLIVFVIVYLVTATVIALNENQGYLKFGYARCIYIVITTLIFSNQLLFGNDLKFYKRLIDVTMLGIIVINLISLFDVININQFISSYYTQYLQNITDYQLSIHKPIMTFGVHNIAAFIYEGVLLISYYWYGYFKEKKYLIYIIILLALLMLLRCSTSIVYLIFDIVIIVYKQARNSNKMIVTIVGLVLFMFTLYFFGIADLYVDVLGKNANGWTSRYVEGIETIFANNIEAIKKYPMGTGFCIAAHENGLYGADSGFIINYTIGNIFYFVFIYYLLIKKIKTIFSVKLLAFVFVVYIVIMELGFVTFLYYKTIAFIIVLFSIISCTENHILKKEYLERNSNA